MHGETYVQVGDECSRRIDDDDDDDEDNGEPTKCRRRFFIFASIDDPDNASTRPRLVHVYVFIYA